jgi:hypothetical protein
LEALRFAGELSLGVRSGVNYYQPIALKPPLSNTP